MPTYAPAADWRYAGIQLLFISPARDTRQLSKLDQDLPRTLRTKARTSDQFIKSARTRSGVEKMRGGLLLMTLLLIVKLHHSLGGCDEPRTRRSTSENMGSDRYKRSISKRYSDLDYDSFVGLMGKRDADADDEEPRKREMHDVFVGLLGRRNSESGNGPWRRDTPERRGIFLNKCRMRLLQGL